MDTCKEGCIHHLLVQYPEELTVNQLVLHGGMQEAYAKTCGACMVDKSNLDLEAAHLVPGIQYSCLWIARLPQPST